MTDRPVRLLDLGEVSPLRSQALYHGLGESMDAEAPDTIVFCRPAAPCFSVGHHQSPRETLDLDWCRRAGYPVFQRRIGGGAVFLDASQLFYQCIFHRRRAPLMVAAIYQRFLMPAVEALRGLGLPASLEGINEIEVAGRRIAGTGGGQIGESMVVTGNILFDFDYDAMTRGWRVPSEPFRRLAADGLRRHVTTLKRELARVPLPGEVSRLLIERYAEALGSPLLPGALTAREEQALRRAERELTAPARGGGGLGRPGDGLKIARGVYVREVEVATSAGPVRVTLRLRDGTIDDLVLTGPLPGQRRLARTVGTGAWALRESRRGLAREAGTEGTRAHSAS